MLDEWVNQALDEHTRLVERQQDPELRAVMTALFLEDLTGVVLTDEEIDPGLLSSQESVRQLLRSKARMS